MNILVTGANGQLGKCIQDVVNDLEIIDNIYIFKSHDELDITNYSEVEKFISINDIKVVINCAAYTNVDKAEDEYEKCMFINSMAVKQLAEILEQRKGLLIHISTDYVINSQGKNTPISEDMELLDPDNTYGKSKLQGEQNIIQSISKYIILRTSWLYSEYNHNFLKTIYNKLKENPEQELKVVDDQIGTPTYAFDLAKAIVDICEEYIENTNFNKFGIYNYANMGVCSWYDFAQVIRLLNFDKSTIYPCKSVEYPSKVKRPSYSVLDKTKIKTNFPNIEIPYWIDSLKKCLNINF